MTEEQKIEIGNLLKDSRGASIIEYIDEQKSLKLHKLISGEGLEPVLVCTANSTKIFVNNMVFAEIKVLDNLKTFLKTCIANSKEKTDE